MRTAAARVFLLSSALVTVSTARAEMKVEQVAGRAQLVEPFGVAFDNRRNLYICEHKGERVTKVDPKGNISVLSGPDAGWKDPHAVVIRNGRTMYVADTLNNRVQQIDLDTGKVSTLAGTGAAGYGGDGGPANQAKFDGTFAIALSAKGDRLYVADLRNRRIRAIDLKSGIIRTVAGNGEKGVPADGSEAASSPLVDPRAVAVDRRENVYVLERNGNALRVVDPAGKIRTLIAPGSSQGPDMNGPKHLTIDRDGAVIIADAENHLVRRYDPRTGKFTVMAGAGKPGTHIDAANPLATELNRPHGVYVHTNGDLYISDSYNHRILRISGR